MAIILQLTEAEKHSLIDRYMDEKTAVKHMLYYHSKSNFNHKDYLELYTANQHTIVEGVILPVVGSPKQVLV